jgi:hypothetical protein
MTGESPSAEPERESPPAPAKKAYRKPVLTEYGSISKLTRTGGATRTELGSPRSRRKSFGCL